MTWAIVISLVTALAGLGAGVGAHRWWTVRAERKKINAEASKATAEATVALAAADDEHLKTVVGYVIEPLRAELDRLREQVTALEGKVTVISRRYRALIEWARQVLAWQKYHPNIDPPIPKPPAEVTEDL